MQVVFLHTKTVSVCDVGIFHQYVCCRHKIIQPVVGVALQHSLSQFFGCHISADIVGVGEGVFFYQLVSAVVFIRRNFIVDFLARAISRRIVGVFCGVSLFYFFYQTVGGVVEVVGERRLVEGVACGKPDRRPSEDRRRLP